MIPPWLTALIAAGYTPYIATSARLLPHLDVTPFGEKAALFVMENPAHKDFLEAYLLSNSLSFTMPGLKMPHWVMIDCALMQSAIVGFMKPVATLPATLLNAYRADPSVDLDRLTHLPVSGQIASPAVGEKEFVGFSLFSLAAKIDGRKNLGLYTKALAFEVYRVRACEGFSGITYYDSPAVKIHARFGRTEIVNPIVPLHLRADMAFLYRLKPDYDPMRLQDPPEPVAPTFLLKATDLAAKQRMQERQAAGKRFFVVPPYLETKSDGLFLPIVEA